MQNPNTEIGNPKQKYNPNVQNSKPKLIEDVI
jgi:hypothetical protein